MANLNVVGYPDPHPVVPLNTVVTTDPLQLPVVLMYPLSATTATFGYPTTT